MNSILMIQYDTMQQRMVDTLKKISNNSLTIMNYTTYKSSVLFKNNELNLIYL